MVAYTKHDLQFILDGVVVSETHADATNTVSNGVWTVADLETSRQILLGLIPNSLEPIGMRTISGELNNLVIGQENFGATGEFPRLLDPEFRNEGDDAMAFGPPMIDDNGIIRPILPGEQPTNFNFPGIPPGFFPPDNNLGPGGTDLPGNWLNQNDYNPNGANTTADPRDIEPSDVVDADPRIISNLIVDQTVNNPVALNAALNQAGVEGPDHAQALIDIPAAFQALQDAIAVQLQPLLDALAVEEAELLAAQALEAQALATDNAAQAALASYNAALLDVAATEAALQAAVGQAAALVLELQDNNPGVGLPIPATQADIDALAAAVTAATNAINAANQLVLALDNPDINPAELARAQQFAADVTTAGNFLLAVNVIDGSADPIDVALALISANAAATNLAELAGSLADPNDGLADDVANSQAAASGTAAQTANDLLLASQTVAAEQVDVDAANANIAAAQQLIVVTEQAFLDQLDLYGLTGDSNGLLVIENTAPDEGLSAPFNAWMTFFGQFFDHGLDLVQKGGNGTVYIPLQPDDPLYDANSNTNFMVLTRATLNENDEATNFTSPHVDQNQTYTSHPSHQIFVRDYAAGPNGPVATGLLIEGTGGGMANWGNVKTQARELLGIELTDAEALDIPLFAVDQYGEFLRGANGLPQFVIELQNAQGDVVGTTLVEGLLPAMPGDPGRSLEDAVAIAQQVEDGAGTGLTAAASLTGFAFLLDIAHTAAPVFDQNGDLAPDPNGDAGGPNDPPPPTGTYDNELLDAHFIAGDGRANENIGLTAVHHVFHGEHNRLVEHTKLTLLSGENNSDLGTIGDADGVQAALDLLGGYLNGGVPQGFVFLDRANFASDAAYDAALDAQALTLNWDGDRLFQAAKFGTEMQYQHLVFEEFARKVQPLVDLFASYETSIDAAIVAEFAHTVYRFGHSMLTENVPLMDTDGNLTEVGLIEAFLNPLGFHHQIQADGTLPTMGLDQQDSSIVAGALARGLTREVGNEIDEFVTDALRSNLLGLPLDLAAINIARGRETGIPSLNQARTDFFEGTGDTKLKPYDSWVDFALHLKNGGASIVNFIAAYGTHDLVERQTTVEAKRAAAFALTTGDDTDIAALDGAYVATEIDDRLDFLNAQGAWAGDVQLGGLNLVDFWIGGLAEAIEPFGGMLGSTFNFVFEQQLEDLQDGDRFYYLGRTGGLNFLSQLEQNSFANMIIRNTDIGDNGADHLPGDIFSTPNWILEVDQSRQVTGLGVDGRDDPTGDGASGGELNPFLDLGSNSLVIRDNPNTVGPDTNYLQYTGGDHVVLGGTDQNDILIGGVGDDTIWGDDGDDTIEGGDGGDILLGGKGDDILTDIGGPNNIQGQEGNDAISAGGGEALILGGSGKDFVLQGPDLAETFGGLGNDFINAGTESNIVFGNEGNDWLEGGGGNNLLVGDNGDPFLNSTAGGHDVFISGLGDDDYDSEGGDDIMEGADGVQRFEGLNGFDWATYMHVDQGVNVDMLLRAFDETPLPPSNVSIMDRFDSVEGLSGGRGNDILRGDDEDRLFIEAINNGNNSVLTGDDRFAQIRGLREGDNAPVFDANAIFGSTTTEWGEGDIILGGAGSDLIEGRGGDDIIDGDLKLQVRLLATDGNGNQATAFKMEGQLYEVDVNGSLVLDGNGDPTPTTLGGFSNLDDTVFNRVVNPGDIEILREIVDESDMTDFDTVEFSGNSADYTINLTPDAQGFISVTDNVGTNGTDLLRGIERLTFSDGSVNLEAGNALATGQPTILDELTQTLAENISIGQELRADPAGIMDADLIPPGTFFSFTWQFEETPGAGDFVDFEIVNASGETGPLVGEVITVPPEAVGFALRVIARFTDGDGVLETVTSNATEIVANVVVTPATEGDDIIIGTVNGETINALGGDDEIRALAGNDTLIGGTGNDILDGGLGIDTARFLGNYNANNFMFSFNPEGDLEVVDLRPAVEEEDVNLSIELFQFNNQTFTLEAARAEVAADTARTAGDDIIVGTAGDDAGNAAAQLRGQGGNDTILGQAGDDDIRGGGGSDLIFGGLDDDLIRGNGGDDTIVWNANVDGFNDDGRDVVNGGGNTAVGDTFVINGNDTAEQFDIWAVADAIAAGFYTQAESNAAIPGGGNPVQIVVTRNGNTNADIIAELRSIEEIVINTGGGADTVTPHGDFTPTGLSQNTITINGTEGDDTVDLSEIQSAHRILFRSNGGVDTIVGTLRPQDVIELGADLGSYDPPVFDAATGMWTISQPNGGHSVSYPGTADMEQPQFIGYDPVEAGEFQYTTSDLTELKNLVRGLPSDKAEDYATGVRDLEGTGNNGADPDAGAADQPFIRLTDARYGDYNADDANYDINPIFAGLESRVISDILGDQESSLGPNSEGGNGFFTAFGQYFDHGLDFLPKGGNGTLFIDGEDVTRESGLAPNFADLTRGTVDNFVDLENGAIPEHLNKTSPFVDQNQTYGSTELVGQFLRKGDGSGGLSAEILAGAADPSNSDFNLMPTLREAILHHWENNTVFSDPVHLPTPISFRDYFTDLPYATDPTTIGTLVVDGVINEDLANYLNADFMGSGFALVGDANPFVNILDHYVAGDLRANENYALTSIHTIWARNHNYHVDRLEKAGFDGTAEELFQAAKIVSETEYQRVVFDEFADKLLGGLKGSGEHGHDDYNPNATAAISHEFAAAVYRVGHSLISQTVTVLDENGNPVDVPLTDVFLNPTNDAEALSDQLPPGYVPADGFAEIGVDRIIGGIVDQAAEEVDFNIVDAVRNDLVRVRADLFAFNVARGRDVGLGTLNQVRSDLLNSDDPYVKEAVELSGEDLSPYSSWDDFKNRNGLSAAVIAQFIAAYPDLVLEAGEIDAFKDINEGIEVTIGSDGKGTVKGIDRVDLWVGGLAEEHVNGGMVGATFYVVLHEQFDRLQEADRFYYFDRVDDFDFYEQVEDQSFSDIVARNTGLEGLPEDIFSADGDDAQDDDNDGDDTQDGNDDQTDDGTGDQTDDDGTGDQTGGDGSGGSTDTPMPPVDPVYLTGTDGNDSLVGNSAGDAIAAGAGNDTVLGGSGPDTLAGDEGNDQIVGGAGNNILLGGDGDDLLISEGGNDEIFGGDGIDRIKAGDGDDFISGGLGNDIILAEGGDDIIVTEMGDGDDEIDGGQGIDTLDLTGITADVAVDLGAGLFGSAQSTQTGLDSLTGIENVVGGRGDDTIIANSEVNVVAGGFGDDTFVFNSIEAANGDHIADFEAGDKIDLRGIAANYDFGGNGDFTFLGSTGALTEAGQLIVRTENGETFLEGSVDDVDGADFAIKISGQTDLNDDDFVA